MDKYCITFHDQKQMWSNEDKGLLMRKTDTQSQLIEGRGVLHLLCCTLKNRVDQSGFKLVDELSLLIEQNVKCSLLI